MSGDEYAALVHQALEGNPEWQGGEGRVRLTQGELVELVRRVSPHYERRIQVMRSDLESAEEIASGERDAAPGRGSASHWHSWCAGYREALRVLTDEGVEEP